MKERYPSTSKFARRGLGCGRWNFPPPPRPTEFAPGTPGKVAVLEERASLGCSLWHPQDAAFRWRRERPTPAASEDLDCA